MKIYNYPKWLTVLYPGSIWGFFRPKRKVLYLTFDDGPSTAATKWILELLENYNAEATFFCLGNQAEKHPDLLAEILLKGHSIGNHSMTHPRGWKTNTKQYLEDVLIAEKHIDSKMFRPPYGSLKLSQHKAVKRAGFKTIFWSYVTYDFATDVLIDKVLKKMKRLVKSGDIIVFHDSAKALPQLQDILPEALRYYKEKGYSFEALKFDTI